MSGVVVLNQLSSRVVDAGGRSVAIADGYSITSDNLAFLVAGTDGTNAQFLRTANDGTLRVDTTGSTTQPISGSVSISNASGASAVNIQDGGNSITVDNGGTFAVQAAQSGTWNITNISGTVSLPTGAATSANQSTANTHLATLAGAVSGTEVQVDVLTMPTTTIQDGGGSITVDNSSLSVVGGGAEASALRVTIASDSTGTITANQGGTWNITNISGTVSLPTGAATAANQATANASLATLAGAVSGTEVQVDVLTLPTVTIQDGGNTITVDGTVAATQSGTWTNRTQDGYGVPLTALASAPVGTETALLVRNIPSGVQSVTVSGTTNIAKAEDAAFADGDVGVMTLAVRRDTASSTSGTDGDFQPLITNSTGHLWVDASGQTLTAAGNVAHDSADSGNPVKIGAVARTTNPTAVSDADRVNFIADDIGRQVIVSGQVRDLITHQHTQIASSSAETTILTAAGAGVFLDLVQLVMTNQTATAVNVTIRDATAGTTRMIIALPASGGAVIPFTRPIPQSTANNAWTAQLSSAAVTVNIFAMAERNV